MADVKTESTHIAAVLAAFFIVVAAIFVLAAAPITATAQENAMPGASQQSSHPKTAMHSTTESTAQRPANPHATEIDASADEEEIAATEPTFDCENPPELTADIMGKQVIPADAMVAWFEAAGHAYPADVYTDAGAPTIEDFAELCVEEAAAEGVRPEVLFAQVMHETGYLQFGGQVSPEQCNFGGLGATNDGAHGATFPDVRTGLRAQVQHLKAYASTEDLVNEVVDPRFDLVSRGCAPTVYDLGGRWAVPGDTYGDSLMQHLEDMYALAYS